MKKILSTLLAVFLITGSPALSFADVTVDKLINKLVGKGVLSRDEATEILGELSQGEQLASPPQSQQTSEAKISKDELPAWVKSLKPSGDFRLRQEYSKRNDSTDADRNRGRIRYRLGLNTDINAQTKIGVRIASDGGSPRSTNQSLSNTFAKGNIVLDQAYAEFAPNEQLKLTGGKIVNPYWEPSEFLWDADITPEGGALHFQWPANDAFDIFTNLGTFVVDEIAADESDPFFYFIQPGLQWKLRDQADLKLAVAFNGFDNGTKQLLDSRSNPATNTVTGDRYDFTYNTIVVGSELGISKPFKLPIARLSLFGQFIHNPDPSDNNNGWMAGFSLGDQKIKDKGQWKILWNYHYLGKDAWLDAFPDADSYGGATDVKGSETIFEYGLAKNIWLTLDYYQTRRITADKAQEKIMQSDLNFKF